MNSYNSGHYSPSGEYIADYVPDATAPYAYGYSFYKGKNCDSTCNGLHSVEPTATKPTFNDNLRTQPATVESFENKPITRAEKETAPKPLQLPNSLKFLQQ